jgi:putative glutamine amidotransferase
MAPAPLIGITADNRDDAAASGKYESAIAYSRAVAAAGGTPVILPHLIERIADYLEHCDGFVFTGGADLRTEAFGEPTHPAAQVMDPTRQAFELALLAAIAARVNQSGPSAAHPVLGVCLGMQLMALHAGGRLHQHLPEVLADAAVHAANRRHALQLTGDAWPWLALTPAQAAAAEVVSHHHQAVAAPGTLRVLAAAPDGIIEAVADPERLFHLGVQWHPERHGGDPHDPLGLGLFSKLVQAARNARGH